MQTSDQTPAGFLWHISSCRPNADTYGTCIFYQLEILSALEGVAALQGHGVVVAHEGLQVADVLELRITCGTLLELPPWPVNPQAHAQLDAATARYYPRRHASRREESVSPRPAGASPCCYFRVFLSRKRVSLVS